MHIESLENRRLMAAGGLDPSFGTNGVATLPSGVGATGAVASLASGTIYSARDKTGRDFLYKLTNTGQLDTAWGDQGRVATPAFGASQLVYDKRYDLLYAAGVTQRFTNGTDRSDGNVAGLRIERFNASTGAVDTGFGENGIASFVYGKSNTSVVNLVDVAKLLPLTKRGLAVAFDYTAFQSNDDYFGDTNHAVSSVVLKYTASGSRDSRFGRRGILNVESGYHNYTSGNTEDTQRYDDAAIRDIQARDDGGFRVITVRAKGSSLHVNDDAGIFEISERLYLRSQVLNAKGVTNASQDRTWLLAKTSPANIVGIVSGEYQSLLVRAEGDDSVLTIGRRAVGQEFGNYVDVTEAVTFAPEGKTSVTLKSLKGVYFNSILPSGRNYFAVAAGASQVWSTKLRSTFKLATEYNADKATLITPLPDRNDAYVVADNDGRLLAFFGNQVFRISG